MNLGSLRFSHERIVAMVIKLLLLLPCKIMRFVSILGSFSFSTVYNLVSPLPVMASSVESLACSTSKVVTDGDGITLTHQGEYTDRSWQVAEMYPVVWDIGQGKCSHLTF